MRQPPPSGMLSSLIPERLLRPIADRRHRRARDGRHAWPSGPGDELPATQSWPHMSGPPDGQDPGSEQQITEARFDEAGAGSSATATPPDRLDNLNGVRNDNGATAELTKFLSRTPFPRPAFSGRG